MRSTASQTGGKLDVIAIDRSFSMRDGDHMEQAKEEARKLVRDLPAGFVAQVAALDSHLETLNGNETDRGALNAAIDGLTAGDQTSSYGELARGSAFAG